MTGKGMLHFHNHPVFSEQFILCLDAVLDSFTYPGCTSSLFNFLLWNTRWGHSWYRLVTY